MVNYNSGFSRSLQIADLIKAYIKEACLHEGEKLPSIAKLAAMYSAGKDSVNEAMSILSYDGTVVIKPRHGVFVAGNAWKNLHPMTPEWHDFTSKSLQEPNSTAYGNLIRKMAGAKEEKRSLSNPFIDSSLFPDIMKDGLKKAGELYLRKDLDTWFFNSNPLREKLCEYMESYGLYVSPEHVVIMAGGVDALTAICVSTMRRGMELLYGAPSYVPAKKRLTSYGISMTGVPMDREGMSKDAILQQLKSGSKKMLYIAPTFSNPSGIVMSKKRREELLRICNNTKTPIIEIDSYRELSNNLPLPIASLDHSDTVIYVGSIREILPMGCSISWLVVPLPILERFYHYRTQSDLNLRINELFFYSILQSGAFYEYRDMFHAFLLKRRVFTENVLSEYLGDMGTWDSNGHPLMYWIKLNDNIDMKKIYDNDDILLYRGSEYWSGYDRYLTISSMNFSKDGFIKAIKGLADAIRS